MKAFTWIALFLAFGVVVLGAYTRLTDAGLGCPDWPGCYGKPIPQVHEINSNQFPSNFSASKAWTEMIHRYFAGSLGILIFLNLFLSLKNKNNVYAYPWISIFLFLFVVFQALLGMWTVTKKLHPPIVMAHLLGGVLTLGLLAFLAFKRSFKERILVSSRLWSMAFLGLMLIGFQIALGGWVSSNYAALVCPDFPACLGKFFPVMDWNSFFVPYDASLNYEGGILNHTARVTIHMAHRFGAYAVVVYWFCLLDFIFRQKQAVLTQAGFLVLIALSLQFLLGVFNIFAKFPLFLSVAHNAGAALLLISAIHLNYRLNPRKA